MQDSEIDNLIISVGSHCHNWLRFLSQHLSRVGRDSRGWSNGWILPKAHLPSSPRLFPRMGKPEDRRPPSRAQTHTACHPPVPWQDLPTHLASPLTLRVSLQDGGCLRWLLGFGRSRDSCAPSLCPAGPSGLFPLGSRLARWPNALSSTPWEILSGFSQPRHARRVTRVSRCPP